VGDGAIKKLSVCSVKSLGLHLHQKEKRFVGRIEKGFDFLGYHFNPGRKLRPSAESLRRLVIRAGRLYEQKDSGLPVSLIKNPVDFIHLIP
jgi:hypothetical protein